MDFSNDLSKSVSVDNDNDEDDDDIQFIGEKSSSENRSHPVQSGETGEHEHSSVTTAKFRCQICKESQTSFVNLHKHLKNVHNATIKLTCNLCGKTFNENRSLITHIEDHKTKRSNFSESKSKSKRKKSASKSKPKAKNAKRARKSKNKTEKSTCFTKGKRQRGAASREQAKKSKIGEAEEITSSSSVESDKTNDGSKDRPSTEISIPNDMSPPPPSPSPVSPPQNPSGEDDWGWDTDPRLPQPELSTTLELQPPPDSSSLSLCVPVITTSPKSSADADLPEHAVFEDYFEPLSPKLEVFDDWDGEDDVSNSATVDNSPISHNVSENPSPFPFQCSKCDLQFRTSDFLEVHQSFHDLLVYVKFRCEVSSCFQYFDDEVDYQTHFTSSHIKSRNPRSPKPRFKMVLHELKKQRSARVQKPQKIFFADEESEFEDPAEDPLMLIESLPDCDTEAEINGVSAYLESEFAETGHLPSPEPKRRRHLKSDHVNVLPAEETGTGNPNPVNSLSCPQCPTKVFPTNICLQRHLAHHRKIPRHACTICERKFKDRTACMVHIRRHRKERNFTCPVAECSMAFTTVGEQQKHTQRHRPGGPPARAWIRTPKPLETPKKGVCSFCKSQFKTESELSEHKAAHHTGSHPFPCPKCDKKFKARKNLGMHLKDFHATVKPFSCPLCDKHFPLKYRLDRHLLCHPEHHSHRCPICEKPHQTTTKLKEHIQTHSNGPGDFPCPVPKCSRAYATTSQLRRHTRAAHPPQNPGAGSGDGDSPPTTYTCHVCNKIFFIELKYLRHCQIAHIPKHLQDNSGRVTFTCELCDVSFLSRLGWVRHKVKHDSNTDNLCNMCGRLFPTPEALGAHKKTTHRRRKDPQAKKDRIICDVCGKSVGRRALKDHMDRHSEVPLICDVCGKPCKHENDLRLHKNTHLPEKPLKCKFCPYRYNQPTSIYSHMQFHHTGPGDSGFVESPLTADLERSFPCDADGCCRSFTSLPCLKQHQLYHTGDKVFPCKQCGEKFVAKWEVFIHKQEVHKKRFECEYCQKIFLNAKFLEEHVRYNHTLEEPFPCTAPDCDRKFKTKTDLKYHTVVAHTGEYKFECEVCGKKSATRGNHNTHMRVHTLTKDFRCEEEGCEASFKAASLLNKHLYNKHGRTDLAAAFLRRGKGIQPMNIGY